MLLGRRDLLKFAGLAPFASLMPKLARAAEPGPSAGKADYTIRIATGAALLAAGLQRLVVAGAD